MVDWGRIGTGVATGGLSEVYRAADGAGFIDKLTGAEAARQQADAAKKASEDGIAYLQEGADQGYGFIDKGAAGAAGALDMGYDGAQGALGQGRDASLEALINGSQQAQGAIGATPNRLGDLLNGGLASGFQADPGYQFRLQQGEQAINRSAAAHGGRMGAATLEALLAHGQNLASQEYGNYANRTIGLAGGADQNDQSRQFALANLINGTGQQASGIQGAYGNNMAGLATGNANNLATILNSQGNNKANIAIGQAGQSAQLGMAPVQFAGGESRANADAYQQALGLFVAGVGRA